MGVGADPRRSRPLCVSVVSWSSRVAPCQPPVCESERVCVQVRVCLYVTSVG